LEGTLKISWFQPACHEQGHLPLDHIAQSSIQPGLEPNLVIVTDEQDEFGFELVNY